MVLELIRRATFDVPLKYPIPLTPMQRERWRKERLVVQLRRVEKKAVRKIELAYYRRLERARGQLRREWEQRRRAQDLASARSRQGPVAVAGAKPV